ncbi:MAG: hypothetical protein JW894_09885 [Bacteroidales bacterium]|nr:hypothetical protein [Bacteroidales bacterium]
MIFLNSYKKLTRFLLFLVSLLFISVCSYSQELPVGYTILFENKCTDKSILDLITTDNSEQWAVNGNLKITPPACDSTDTLSQFILPGIMGIINNLILGDFIMEFQVRQDDIKGNFYLIGPAKSKDNLYTYSFMGDSVTFCYISQSEVIFQQSKYFSADFRNWNTFVIERDILKRTTSFKLKNEPERKVIFSHPGLVMGFIGFGADKAPFDVRNIKIWGPTSISEKEFCW